MRVQTNNSEQQLSVREDVGKTMEERVEARRSIAGSAILFGRHYGGHPMSTVILRGAEAIHYAEVHGMSLNIDAYEEHRSRSGLTLETAREIEHSLIGHIWVEAHIGVNTGEHVKHDPVAPGH
jgi:hypothetical protein